VRTRVAGCFVQLAVKLHLVRGELASVSWDIANRRFVAEVAARGITAGWRITAGWGLKTSLRQLCFLLV
jgi:hypothetical protein